LRRVRVFTSRTRPASPLQPIICGARSQRMLGRTFLLERVRHGGQSNRRRHAACAQLLEQAPLPARPAARALECERESKLGIVHEAARYQIANNAIYKRAGITAAQQSPAHFRLGARPLSKQAERGLARSTVILGGTKRLERRRIDVIPNAQRTTHVRFHVDDEQRLIIHVQSYTLALSLFPNGRDSHSRLHEIRT
jgi:hypothetical protein